MNNNQLEVVRESEELIPEPTARLVEKSFAETIAIVRKNPFHNPLQALSNLRPCGRKHPDTQNQGTSPQTADTNAEQNHHAAFFSLSVIDPRRLTLTRYPTMRHYQ